MKYVYLNSISLCLLFFQYYSIHCSLEPDTALDLRAVTCPTCPAVGPIANFCNVSIANQLCVSGNAQIGGDLTVCGSIITSAQGFSFAYSTLTQTVGVPAPDFTDIIFTDNPVMNGWNFTPPGSEFTCTQAGTYLIQYDAISRITNSQLTDMSIIALLNDIEIAGSQGSIQQPINNRPLALTRSFIVDVNENDVLELQFTGGTPFVQLEANSGNSTITVPLNGIRPSITLTITRIS